MKRFGFLFVPILVILLGTTVVPTVLANGTSPVVLVLISIALFAVMFLFRPKKAATKSAQQVAEDILDEFCADAFAQNEDLGRKYLSALNDIGNNMPKAASNKLKKLEQECVTDPQKYAVAMASAKTSYLIQDYKNVIREYNKAIVLHPSDRLAYRIGECQQRLGNLDKAKDSYEFAIELNPEDPQYPSSLGTVCVGNGDYDEAITYALAALELDDTFSQALATLAISYGMKNDTILYKHYLDKAVRNGYSQEKIETTVKTLKKR